MQGQFLQKIHRLLTLIAGYLPALYALPSCVAHLRVNQLRCKQLGYFLQNTQRDRRRCLREEPLGSNAGVHNKAVYHVLSLSSRMRWVEGVK